MFGVERVLEEVMALRIEVKTLQASVEALRWDGLKAVQPEPAEARPDPATERINRMFAEGLDAVFSFDGKARSHDEVKRNGE